MGYYHETLKRSPEALAGYLEKRGLTHPEPIDRFRLGFADRTLGYHLPNKALEVGPSCAAGGSGSAVCGRAATSTSAALW